MLEHGRVQDKERIIDVVKAKILDFAMDKHSSETLRASWRSIGGACYFLALPETTCASH
jgi:hypothetical protein